MIKLQDFAKQQGVTDRAIQKHLVKYAEELEGLYQRKGPNGTWLTDEACDILRSKMKQAPVAIFEEDPRVKRLEDEKADLQKQLNEANANFQKYVADTAATLAEAKSQLLLVERASSLEADNVRLSAENEAQRVKVAETEKKASEDVQKAQNELVEAYGNFEKEMDLVKKAHEKELQEKDEKIQELEDLTLIDYLKAKFRKKKGK